VWLRRLWLRVLAGKFLFPDIPPIKLEQKVALCAANKIGHPLPKEIRLRDKLPTFHFRLSLLFSLRSTARSEIGVLVSSFLNLKHRLDVRQKSPTA
jgi:hypothetical protein